MLDTILFDLDGTLLPMDQRAFVEAYVTQLCRRYVPCGYDKDLIVKALWTGTLAMVQNDGSCPNEDRFWSSFDQLLGDTRAIRDTIPSFYTEEFDTVKEVAAPSPLARQIVDTLRHKGYTLILATNPLFPAVGVRTRLSWINLRPEDFSLVTTYDNSTFCKPFPGYYQEILKKGGQNAGAVPHGRQQPPGRHVRRQAGAGCVSGDRLHRKREKPAPGGLSPGRPVRCSGLEPGAAGTGIKAAF